MAQPIEFEFTGLWFHFKPGKFAHVNDLQAELGNVVEITLPLFLGHCSG